MQQKSANEIYIVVDVEAAGPHPGQYALLSLGACTVDEARQTFYVELKPDSEQVEAQAMQIHQLSLRRLAETGVPPEEGLRAFADWVAQVTPREAIPVFTAFNAPFDWMFVNEYFHRYLGRNPFGHKALDVKAYYMGLHGAAFADTSYAMICEHYGIQAALTHNAVEDALQEADLFACILADAQEQRTPKER